MFDRTDPADLAALKNEVTLDPNAYGYNPDGLGTQAGVLDIINVPRAEFVLTKPKVSAARIRSATTYDGYDTLTIDEQEWLRWQTGSNGFEEENIIVTDDFKQHLTGNLVSETGPSREAQSFWSAAQRIAMCAAMRAVFERDGSRAEDLFGIDTVITRDDWLAARDS